MQREEGHLDPRGRGSAGRGAGLQSVRDDLTAAVEHPHIREVHSRYPFVYRLRHVELVQRAVSGHLERHRIGEVVGALLRGGAERDEHAQQTWQQSHFACSWTRGGTGET
jgi:hypothetical protein